MRRFSGIFISASRLENLPESIKHGNKGRFDPYQRFYWLRMVR